MTIKELRRKQAKDKALMEDILFIIGVFVLLVLWGQYCLAHGLVIWLDQCLYYTLISVGLINEGSKYREFVGVDRKYRRPWKYYCDIDWEVSHV